MSMDATKSRERLTGCYITIPTMFRDDPELSVDLDAIARHVEFLIEGGCVTGNAVLLAGGAAGDFSTMTFDERVAVWEAVVAAAAGRVPIAVGGQTTSTLELIKLVKAAASIGADYVQVSPPFYHAHTEGDFLDHVLAGADAADIGFIVYNTFWTSLGLSSCAHRAPGRRPQRREPEVVDAGHGDDDVRRRRLEVLAALLDHRQPDAICHEPHPRRPRDRDPPGQLLAPVRGRAVADARSGPLRRGAARDGPRLHAVHGSVGRDRGLHRRATAISTSSAWNSWACRRAATARRPGTSASCSATRRARC